MKDDDWMNKVKCIFRSQAVQGWSLGQSSPIIEVVMIVITVKSVGPHVFMQVGHSASVQIASDNYVKAVL
jgi:hypothetical protein